MFDGVKRDQSWLSPELEAQRFGEAVKKKYRYLIRYFQKEILMLHARVQRLRVCRDIYMYVEACRKQDRKSRTAEAFKSWKEQGANDLGFEEYT